VRIDLVGTTADFRCFGPRSPLPLNDLPDENRATAGRIGEVRLRALAFIVTAGSLTSPGTAYAKHGDGAAIALGIIGGALAGAAIASSTAPAYYAAPPVYSVAPAPVYSYAPPPAAYYAPVPYYGPRYYYGGY
jgi:hypothetical protein